VPPASPGLARLVRVAAGPFGNGSGSRGEPLKKGEYPMEGVGLGITIIVILLVPILYQVVTHGLHEKKRHKEIMETLKKIEEKLSK
jgi:hypothetical protein